MLDCTFFLRREFTYWHHRSTESHAIKNIPQVTLSVDKGTAPKDVTRQVVVAIAIGCDGLSHGKKSWVLHQF